MGKFNTYGQGETKFQYMDQLRKSDIWITGKVQGHSVQCTLSHGCNRVFMQNIQLVLMQQNRLEEVNLSAPVCDQQLLPSKYEGRTSATWLPESSLDGKFLLNLLMMPAVGLERLTPACLPQHSYKKKYKLMIHVVQVKYKPARCNVH